MPSVYRITRKGKKESDKAKEQALDLPANNAAETSENKEKKASDYPLFLDTVEIPNEKAADWVPKPDWDQKEETPAPQPEESKEAPVQEEEKEPAFATVAATGKEENSEAEDLPGLGSIQEIDFSKIDAVYNHSKGSLSQNTSQKGYDEVTSLLMEVFGSESDKRKKKKKKETAPDPTSQEEIQEIFRSPEEAVEEAPAAEAETDSDVTEIPAPPDSQESTREYDPKKIEDALSAIHPESDSSEEPILNSEMKMGDIDNPYTDTYENTNEVDPKATGLPEEYTSPEQYDEFAEHLRFRSFRALCSSVWTFLLAAALFYLESASYTSIYHPLLLQPNGSFGVVYLLVDLQLIFLSALCILPSLGSGIRNLFRGKADRNSLTFVVMLIAGLHALVRIFLPFEGFVLFGTVAVFFAFLTCLANFMDIKRVYRTFRICAARKTKLVAETVPTDSAEMDSFREYLPEDPAIYTVKKADFIENFFTKIKEPVPNTSYGVLILLSVLLSLAFAGFSYWRGTGLNGAIERFVVMAMMTLPLSGIFSVTLPFAHLSKKAEKKDCAIISPAAASAYAQADLVSFTDKEIFPPRSVKVTTIRTYGDTRIDSAILYAAMIFQKLGGPLSQVFKKTISGVVNEISEDFDFLEITADGMCAKIDGAEVFVGNKDYLLSYDFGYTKDEMDEAFEEKAGKIMYMVIGKNLAAKFYIRYSLSPRFEKTLHALYKSGICAAVKTCDPNIDSDLFKALLKNRKIPAGIIKTTDAMKDAPVAEKSDSGIACCSTISNMLHTFVLSDSLVHLIRTNTWIKVLSLLIGAFVVAFLFATNGLSKVTPIFTLVYQLLWMIPVIIPSLTE